MAFFTYTATKGGKTLNGRLESADKKSALEAIRKQGAQPLVVKEVKERGNPLGFLKFGGKVKLKDLAVFTRQLSTMISAGVPLVRSLATLQSQTKSKYFSRVITDVSKNIEGGMSLADAFSKHPTVFSEIYVSMVRAGEAGGILDEILKRLSTQIEKDSSIKKKVHSAMAYPVVILSITLVAFFGIMIFIIPKIGKIITDLGGPGAKLPIYTQAMLSISGFMQHNALYIIVIFFIVVVAFQRYISTKSGKYNFHLVLLKTPVVNTVITKVAVARFARTFASLMSAGVGVLDALEVTGGSMGNKVIEAELKEAAKEVRNGKQLSVPLGKSKYFPPIVAQMLAVGEESGKIDTILVKVADFYDEEVDATIDALSSLIEPLMIIVLGSIVGLIAASVMGPIANLSKNVQNG